MSDNEPSAKVPLLTAAGFLGAALIVALINGFSRGSLFAAFLACMAAAASGYAIWLGMQSKGQGKAATGMLLILGSVGFAGLMFVLWIVDKLR